METEVELKKVQAEIRKLKKAEKPKQHPVTANGDPPSTPRAQAIGLAQELHLTPSAERVKHLLPYTITMQQVSKAKTSVKQALFADENPGTDGSQNVNRSVQENNSSTQSLKRRNRKLGARGVSKVLSMKVKLPRYYIFRKKKQSKKRAIMANVIRKKIIEFLQREDNSYTLPGKRDHVRGQQIYALCDTLRNLHNKFILENPELAVSGATFCRARPWYIRLTRYTQRKVCLCYKHTNISLKLQAVKSLPKSTSALIELSDEEIQGKLNTLPNENIRYFAWGKEEISYKDGKKTTKLRLHEQEREKEKFTKELIDEMPEFRQHCHRVEVQFNQIRLLKERLHPEVEASCQLDYAENWKAKYMEEVTSAYYDKNQVTIHPMILHIKDAAGVLQVKSFVGVSDVTNHSVGTTYAFIKSLIPVIKDNFPSLQTIHFISDSPSSQYRNKYVCALISMFPSLFQLQGTWSWLESGHGKGPCDGVGGSIKNKADNLVKTKSIISNAHEFCSAISKQDTKMTLIRIDDSQVEEAKAEISRWKPQPVKGVSRMHTIVPINGALFMRETSCFDTCCFTPPALFKNACPAWEETGLVIHYPHTAEGDIPTELMMKDHRNDQVLNLEHEQEHDNNEGRINEDWAPDDDDIPVTQLINTKKAQEEHKYEDEDEDEDDMPLSLMKKKHPNLTIGHFIATAFGSRWYVAKVIRIDDDEITLDYMTPYGRKWKWGKSDTGAILREEILHHITSLKKVGKLFEVSAKEKKIINAKFKA